MAGCLVLGDSAVNKLLLGLSKDDISDVLAILENTLQRFSVGEERKYQPEPGVIQRPSGQKVLFRPFTSPSHVGTKIIVHPAPTKDESGQTTSQLPLHGVLVVCDDKGVPAGIINAEEVTGFRTSLSAIIGFTWRKYVGSIVIFGAGKQALWHTRLVLALRGDEIKSITIINRSKPRAQALVDQVANENLSLWKSKSQLHVVESSAADHGQTSKDLLAKADVIFCTVPSQAPLFSSDDLPTDRRPYISAIGSWTPDMIEVDPKLIRKVVDDSGSFNPRNASQGGVLIVDDGEGALKHSGEVLNSGLSKDQLVELGEVLEMRKSQNDHGRLFKWLETELVIYKSIGVSLTDLAAAEAILKLAKQKGVGSTLSDL